ncbi:MAG TPA: glycosyltransferase [Chloroflexota bacterium]|nr:glycosyltransferase [Chloroflexota bacterium]
MIAPSDPIDIAYVLNQFGAGGAERQLVGLLARLDASRYRPCVYVGKAEGPIADELHHMGVRVQVIGGPIGRKLALPRLILELRRSRPVIVHTYMFAANTWGRLAGRITGVPVVISSVRNVELDLPLAYRWLDTLLSPLCDRVIGNSHAVTDYLRTSGRAPRRKLVTIYNGVDAARFQPGSHQHEVRARLGLPQQPTVGMVASFGKQKRWDVFLEAMAQLPADQPLTLACVGDGALRPSMEHLARELGLGDRVRFLGIQAAMPDVYAALDVFVLTSAWEGMPNVVLEAMASGLPVVATSAPGTTEVVLHGETGLLAQVGDAPAVAHHVRTLLDNPESARRMGVAGRQRVESDFSYEACVGKTVRLYEELLARRVQASPESSWDMAA